MKSRQEVDKYTVTVVTVFFTVLFSLNFTVLFCLVFKDISATCEEGCVCENDKCVTCKDPYVHNGTSCRRCSTRCQKCSSSDRCIECEEQFTVVLGCCLPCDKGSALCIDPRYCQLCLPGYFLKNFSCNPCPANCQLCSARNSCDSCKEKWFRNESTSLCAQCPTNCISCNSSTNCTVCQAGFYGPECEHKCLTGCRNNQCDKDTGYCRCMYGLYGPSCSYRCPRNCVSCQLTSNCSTCQQEVHDLSCETCVEGKHGDQCDKDCPENCRKCNVEGNCTECVPGFHGNDCKSLCSAGCLNSTCSKNTGQCAEGCVNGTNGSYCLDTEAGFSLTLWLIGINGGAAMFLSSSVVLTLCVVRCQRKSRHRGRNGSENTGPLSETSAYLELDLNQPAITSTNDYRELNISDTEVGLPETSYQDLDVNASSDKAYSQLDTEVGKEKEKSKILVSGDGKSNTPQKWAIMKPADSVRMPRAFLPVDFFSRKVLHNVARHGTKH